MHIKISSLALLLIGLFGFNSAMAADDIYLCSDAFKGESQHVNYLGCIEPESWSWGESLTINLGAGGIRDSARVAVDDLVITKRVDKSSPVLMTASTGTTIIPVVELFVDRCSIGCKERAPYYTLKLENVLVTSVMLGGQRGGTGITENVSLNFEKVTWCHTPINGEIVGTEVCGTWNVVAAEP